MQIENIGSMIRLATLGDLESIVEIYNQAIGNKFQTAFTEKVNVADRLAWFQEHTADAHPLFVYTTDGIVTGWASVSPYRQGRAALRYTVEISYFVHTSYLGHGIGSQLLEHVLHACRALNYRTALAIILDRNIPSIKLVEKFAFEKWGYLPGVADFDGLICGHLYYGKTLATDAGPSV